MSTVRWVLFHRQSSKLLSTLSFRRLKSTDNKEHEDLNEDKLKRDLDDLVKEMSGTLKKKPAEIELEKDFMNFKQLSEVEAGSFWIVKSIISISAEATRETVHFWMEDDSGDIRGGQRFSICSIVYAQTGRIFVFTVCTCHLSVSTKKKDTRRW